jgi:hypothetical protein
MRAARRMICMEEIRNACRILIGKPEGTPLERPRHDIECFRSPCIPVKTHFFLPYLGLQLVEGN